MVGAGGGRVRQRGGCFGSFILSVEETADGAARSSSTTIDAKIRGAGVRSKEARVSVCAERHADDAKQQQLFEMGALERQFFCINHVPGDVTGKFHSRSLTIATCFYVPSGRENERTNLTVIATKAFNARRPHALGKKNPRLANEAIGLCRMS